MTAMASSLAKDGKYLRDDRAGVGEIWEVESWRTSIAAEGEPRTIY